MSVYMDEILKSFKKPRKKAYRPRFNIQREKSGWRVFDGKKAIAFCYPTFFDIWSFSPFEKDIIANPDGPGKVVDLHTLYNTYVNIALHGWPERWKQGIPDLEKHVKWTWVKKSGARLEAKISAAWDNGERGQWVFRMWYDPAWARYRYAIDIDVWKLDPAGMEPLNMMLAGALQAEAKDRRWTHSVWENQDGQLRRVVHSNALFHSTDYAAAEWRMRNAPYRGAWMAYAAHKTFNPAILVHDNNVPMRFAICSQLFDEHVIWNDAGEDNLDEDGYFHFTMKAEFANLPAALARKYLKKATDPIKPKRWREAEVPLAFHMNTVNSFEKPVDPWQAEDCPIISVPTGNEGPVQWTTEAAHSGRRSIRLEAKVINERQEVFPTGAVCNVTPHRRYRLSGWIKTKGVHRYARLELDGIEYQFENKVDSAASAKVTGTRNWTRVEVELDAEDQPYLMPRLVLYGPGVAWFDDVKLEEVR